MRFVSIPRHWLSRNYVDPSYAHQIVNFTFPHIGNVGANNEDDETAIRSRNTHIWDHNAFLHRKTIELWIESTLSEDEDKKITGISGVDTRYITKLIRDEGMMSCLIEHRHDGIFDIPKLLKILEK